MGLCRTFTFAHASGERRCWSYLGFLVTSPAYGWIADDVLVFSKLPEEPGSTFGCELSPSGLRLDRAGEHFAFVGPLTHR